MSTSEEQTYRQLEREDEGRKEAAALNNDADEEEAE